MYLNEFPFELIEEILLKLPISDLIKCRLLSKKIRNVIDFQIKVKSLIVSLNQLICDGKWFYSYESFNLDDLVKVKNLDFLQIQPFNTIFSKLKRLYIYDFPEVHLSFDLENLNFLNSLQHLELWFLRLKNQSKLSSPNLKYFCINEHTTSKLIINTQLAHFKTVFELNLFDFNFAESIKSIQCHQFYGNEIKKFKNLEYLCCQTIKSLDSNFLIQLEHLKSIQFHDTDQMYFELRDQKKQFRRRDLRIYFLGINFDEENDLSRYNLSFNRYFLNENNLNIYLDNYGRLDDRIPFIDSIDYNAIENHFNTFDNMPINFFARFPLIKSILINDRINDQASFWTFLNNYKQLYSLRITNSRLNQAFFDQLPSIFKSIGCLKLEEEEDNIKSLEFILNFQNLLEFDTNKSMPIDLIRQTFQNLKHLESLTFKIDHHLIYVGKEEFGYEVDVTDLMATYKCNLDDLMEFLINKDYEEF